jgi:hypothetical protein
MIPGDPALPPDLFAALPYAKYLLALAGALFVVVVGKWLAARARAARRAVPVDLLAENKES